METVVTTENFETEVLNADIPVMVDFYAVWCGPCQMMAPVLANFAEKNAGKVKVCKCDVDVNTELAINYKVRSVPTIIVFKNGEVSQKSIGAISMEEMEALIAE